MRPKYTISDAWCTNIPVLHQIMNGSRSPSDFPSPVSGVELRAACAIWEPLHYLLKSLLGWQNPGKGLAWWYQAGKPVSDSPLLQLVATATTVMGRLIEESINENRWKNGKAKFEGIC